MQTKLESLLFSDRERFVLKIIGRKRITIQRIVDRFYLGSPPLNGNTIIASLVRKISAKCERDKLPWTIRGEGVGRTGRTVWRTKI